MCAQLSPGMCSLPAEHSVLQLCTQLVRTWLCIEGRRREERVWQQRHSRLAMQRHANKPHKRGSCACAAVAVAANNSYVLKKQKLATVNSQSAQVALQLSRETCVRFDDARFTNLAAKAGTILTTDSNNKGAVCRGTLFDREHVHWGNEEVSAACRACLVIYTQTDSLSIRKRARCIVRSASVTAVSRL